MIWDVRHLCSSPSLATDLLSVLWTNFFSSPDISCPTCEYNKNLNIAFVRITALESLLESTLQISYACQDIQWNGVHVGGKGGEYFPDAFVKLY